MAPPPTKKTSTMQMVIIFLIILSIVGLIVFSTIAQEKMFVANPTAYAAQSIANNAYDRGFGGYGGYGYGYAQPATVFNL